MKKIARAIVKCRIPILILAVLLLIPSFISYTQTKVNYDILYYLPSDIETMQGQDILLDEFGKGAYALVVCEGMSDKEVRDLGDKVSEVEHVTNVLSYSELADKIPEDMLPDNIKDVFYSKTSDAKLMILFFDTSSSADETMDAIQQIRSIAGEQCFLSSMSAIVTDTRQMVNDELATYVTIAVVLCAIVLAVTMDSFLLPVMFLLDIGMAIIYNLGTNFIQGEISFITMALVAVLQLGVTMDYSIFLYNSYKEQKQLNPGDKKEAMANAIVATMTSITGSGLTTIFGFLALCFMSFTLGMDLGIVMAKGVLLGMISCIVILPCMLLVFDKAITKTTHKTFHLSGRKFSGFITKHYRILVIIMLLLWIPAVIGYNNVNVYYKLDNSLPEYLGSVQANQELDENFDMSSLSMVLVDSDLSSKDTQAMISEMDDLDGVNFVIGQDSVLGAQIPDEFIPDEFKNVLSSDNWKLLMVSSEYQVATDEINAQCDQLEDIIKSYDPNGMLIGEAACTRDLIEITNTDFTTVSLVSIGIIFLLIALVLQSFSLPVILVAVIELAIYINMSLAFYTGVTLPFVASVCIGTIQLGSTVDYAILMTTRYKAERLAGNTKQESVRIALSTSMHSIITSALGMFAATIGVGIYSDVDMISSLCVLLGRGALVSMVVVLVFLPAMLVLLDKPICCTTRKMSRLVRKNGGNQ